MQYTLFLSLRDDVRLTSSQAGLTISWRGGELVVNDATPTMIEVLQRLRSKGEDETALIDLTVDDGVIAIARTYHILSILSRRCLLIRTVQEDGAPLASVVPVSRQFEWGTNALVRGSKYVLSRFAYLRREGAEAVLESPRCHARLILHHWSASAVTHALMRPRTVDEVAAALSHSHGAVDVLMALLLRVGLLTGVTETDGASEDSDPALECWEFHDLLFHARSREGRHDGRTGATYRFVPRVPAPPALKTVDAEHWIGLYHSDIDSPTRSAGTFDAVHARNRSVRAYGPRSITTDLLGEFLFRVARVTQRCDASIDTPNGPTRISLTRRPYPNAGAAYELELYAAVHSCDGLAPGLYHYDPSNHRLGRLRGVTAHVERLLSDAAQAAAVTRDELQVLLVISARFQRIAWKYESIAYALMLKNVGVLQQTMYLVATAMELGPCALGSGNADVFARAAGTDYYTETSIGEFLLGGGSLSPAVDKVGDFGLSD